MIPEKIIVTAQGEYKPGLAVVLSFKVSEKNDYSYVVFLDSRGRKEIGKDELLKEFDRAANFFPMDFRNARAVFTGAIEAQVLSKEEVEAAIHAYEMFKKHWDYPPDYLDNLKGAVTINPESKCVIRVDQI